MVTFSNSNRSNKLFKISQNQQRPPHEHTHLYSIEYILVGRKIAQKLGVDTRLSFQ